MTPSQVIAMARRKVASETDSFWAEEELLHLIYQASLELSREAFLIENIYTTTSVASQEEYDIPTQAIKIKRITYNGSKLTPITDRMNDSFSLVNATVTTTGTPNYYRVWDESIFLTPIPSASSLTIKIWTYDEPSIPTISSTLEIPTLFHPDIVNYLAAEMHAKEINSRMSAYYLNRWEKGKAEAKKWAKQRLRGDSFSSVQVEESLSGNMAGIQ